MITAKELSTRKCVESNKSLFEDVANGFVDAKDMFQVKYEMLNYPLILDEMIQFVDGYVEYAKDNNKRYEGKVLTISRNFYDSMFRDKKKYRKKIDLSEFKDINRQYLEKTKQLQTVIEKYINDNKDGKISNELNSLIILTNNQYKKIAKVHKSDGKCTIIYVIIIIDK